MRRRIFQKIALVDEDKTFLGHAIDENGQPVVVPRMVRTSKYAEQDVALSDGSTATIFRCKECQKAPLDGAKLGRQLRLAWIEEMTAAQKTLAEKRDVAARTRTLEVESAR